MSIFLTENFTGTSGATLQAYNAAWSNSGPGGANLRISSAARLRGTPADGYGTYINSAVAGSADVNVSVGCQVLSIPPAGQGQRAGVLARMQDGATYYIADIRHIGATATLGLARNVAPGGFTGLGSIGVTAGVGAHTLRLEILGTTINVYWNGVLRITVVDTLIAAAGKIGVEVAPRSGAVAADSTGIHLDTLSAEDFGAVPQDLDSIEAISQSVVPVPLLVRETFILEAPAIYSESRVSTPTLTPGAAELSLITPYSNSIADAPLLVLGQNMMPQPAVSQSYTSLPVLIPGPVTIDSIVAISQSRVRLPILALAIILPSIPAFSQSYIKKPTLKSRISEKDTLAPLEVRARAEAQRNKGLLYTTLPDALQKSDGPVFRDEVPLLNSTDTVL